LVPMFCHAWDRVSQPTSLQLFSSVRAHSESSGGQNIHPNVNLRSCRGTCSCTWDFAALKPLSVIRHPD
jgi:hypothetical protein